jgi:predicted transcriptional regulator
VEAKVLSAGNRELLRVIAEKAPGSQAKALAELKGLGSKESEV